MYQPCAECDMDFFFSLYTICLLFLGLVHFISMFSLSLSLHESAENALTLSFLLSAYHMYYTLYRETNPIHCTQTITCALQTHTTNRMWKICAKIRNSYSLCVANPFYSLNFLYDLFHFDKTKKNSSQNR